MRNCLLLNADYQPLHVVPLKRAMSLIIAKKATAIDEDDSEPVRSAYLTIAFPRVVKLNYYVKIPYRAKVALNRKTLVARDKGICQYCGGHGNTIDHIKPRSRGGRHEWTNVVLACSPCNFKKGDRLLADLGWTLRTKPDVPRVTTHLLIGVATIDPAWEVHLGIV